MQKLTPPRAKSMTYDPFGWDVLARKLVYTERVGGSSPSPPTNQINGLAGMPHQKWAGICPLPRCSMTDNAVQDDGLAPLTRYLIAEAERNKAEYEELEKETLLYFILCQCDKRYIKIGSARSPRARLQSLQGSCPYKLKLMWSFPDPNRKLEKEWHERFKHLRVRGEWFKSELDLIEAIEATIKEHP